MPTLTIVAGPNGSGKSTFTRQQALPGAANLVDPDAIARELDPEQPTRAAIAAGREAILRCRALFASRESFVIETTLSGNGPIANLKEAVSLGYQTHVVFIALATSRLNSKRVRYRVSKGGHNVPDADIERRYSRSLENAPVALSIAASGIVIDNSGEFPQHLISVENGTVTWRAVSMPEWAERLLAAIEHH